MDAVTKFLEVGRNLLAALPFATTSGVGCRLLALIFRQFSYISHSSRIQNRDEQLFSSACCVALGVAHPPGMENAFLVRGAYHEPFNARIVAGIHLRASSPKMLAISKLKRP